MYSRSGWWQSATSSAKGVCSINLQYHSLREKGAPSYRRIATLAGTCREQPMQGQWCCRIRSCLFFVIVRPSHSAVRGRPVGAKFDSILFQTFLDDEGKELIPPIHLNSLNEERHFRRDTIKELQRIVRSPLDIYS